MFLVNSRCKDYEQGIIEWWKKMRILDCSFSCNCFYGISCSEKKLFFKATVLFKVIPEVVSRVFYEVHFVKSVQIRSFLWSLFSCKSPYSVRIQENADQKKLRIWTLFTQWWFPVFSNLPKFILIKLRLSFQWTISCLKSIIKVATLSS